ncbi:uncharacterized protein EDB91DRAFT_1083512 [Suillus paluster]|uniref:uncharacterized protein n=1 Tax=Suillus paluster TaxID=48578 RepID=UPI001B882443|nr:uncharacterized protein EDB91DRAFT_1083512 [Suillus paluster]KAG1735878.1 hypothetical protein EDB91DRAFT_1083512 [Suillus paluster]
MFLDDPNEAIRPDYTSDEHQQAREQLVNEGFTEEQAIRSLASLWTLTNNADKQCWALRQERLETVRQCEAQEEEQRQQACEEEDEAARLEERKKNKNKYTPFGRGKTTLKKLSQIAELDTLVMLLANDGIHSWIPADAVKDPKATAVTRDENLTWEEFNEVAPCMINFMKLHDWLNKRVTMHVQFWSALQAHCWRHTSDHLKQRALLLYQSQQQRRWHLAIGPAQSWSLEEINQELLTEAREELFNKHQD